MTKLFAFKNRVCRLSFGTMTYTVLFIPDKLYTEISTGQTHSRLRVIAAIKGYSIKCALLPAGDGTYYILLSKNLQKKLSLSHGDELNVTLELDDPDGVDLPDELALKLEENPEALSEWNKLTPGKQRGLAYRISSAKLQATRKKRVDEVIDSLFPLRFKFEADGE